MEDIIVRLTVSDSLISYCPLFSVLKVIDKTVGLQYRPREELAHREKRGLEQGTEGGGEQREGRKKRRKRRK